MKRIATLTLDPAPRVCAECPLSVSIVLKEIISEAKANGINIKGKTYDIISAATNLGTTQVKKYIAVDSKATDDVKESLKAGKTSLEKAFMSTRDPVKKKKDKPATSSKLTEENAANSSPKHKVSDDYIEIIDFIISILKKCS